MESYKVLIKPVITEKVHLQKESNNTISFKVNSQATKVDVKKAIEDVLDVKVMKVNILNQDGKKKRLGKFVGKRSGFKKAMITLKKGEKVPFFEM